MRILYVTYEVAPYFQTGGLGDVSRDLPIALSKISVKTSIILPKYKFIKLPNKIEKIEEFNVSFNQQKEKINLYSMEISRSINLFLVAHPLLEDPINKGNSTLNFTLFSKAIAYLIINNNQNDSYNFDLLHLNDWFAGATPYYLKKIGDPTPNIITIHNLMYRGYIGKEIVDTINMGYEDKKYESLLDIGLNYADSITTVSPTYANEITHSRSGQKIGRLLFKRRNDVEGILNGINYDEWNSSKDKYIQHHFSVSNVNKGKINNKLSLQQKFNLHLNQDIPLISFIGRLATNQKGIDLICKILETLLVNRNFQFVLLGTGDLYWAKKIGSFVKRYPKNMVFINKFNQSYAHQIYAASDIILVPSKYEPCGLVQMIAMRYGALPLVRKTGGLADTVKDGVNGFVFEKYSATELTRTLRLALKLFNDNPEKITKMRENAMKEDFSWDKSARQYKKLYQKLIDNRHI